MRGRVPFQEGRHVGGGSGRLRGLAPLGCVPPGLPGLGATAHQVSSRLSAEATGRAALRPLPRRAGELGRGRAGRPPRACPQTPLLPAQMEGRQHLCLPVHPLQGQPASLGTQASQQGPAGKKRPWPLLVNIPSADAKGAEQRSCQSTCLAECSGGGSVDTGPETSSQAVTSVH